MKKKDLELVLRDPKFPKDFIPQVGQALICLCCRSIVILLEALMITVRLSFMSVYVVLKLNCDKLL